MYITQTVTGATDSGKTTLINALDLITPKDFRKVYVEDAVESLNQLEYGKHQLKYVVEEAQESSETRIYSKSNQIKTLLHRSPDIIYLGEILTKEEGEALFHCLAAGLKGFQTIHSKNIGSLMNRIIHFFKIEKSCLNDLDVLILMKKDQNKRRVVSICETRDINPEDTSYVNTIYEYDPIKNRWNETLPITSLNLTNEIRKFENLSEQSLEQLLDIFKEIFEHLSNINRIAVDKLVDLFHKISYFSYNSYPDLKAFWQDIKSHLV